MLCTNAAVLQMALGFPSEGGTRMSWRTVWVQLTATIAQQHHTAHPRKVTENGAPLQRIGIIEEA